jgi:hypothetical protein
LIQYPDFRVLIVEQLRQDDYAENKRGASEAHVERQADILHEEGGYLERKPDGSRRTLAAPRSTVVLVF